MSMKSKIIKILMLTLFLVSIVGGVGMAQIAQSKKPKRMVGMYVHQHWPYRRPYAARTWTIEDWRGYADAMKQLGFNTFLVWPMLETMPEPLTSSDRASLIKMGKVIEMLHKEFGMRVYICLCPNIIADSKEAAKLRFTKRHYYYCDVMINPGDPVALEHLIWWREQLMGYLKNVDGVAIIDSDPGGYVGSTNSEFVHLLGEHRKMLDRLRPGIELIYWMHAGWRGWSRFYETGKMILGTPEEQLDTLTQLKQLNPEPWGLANGLPYAEKLGIAEKVISFNYGRIEAEPSFPLTNFTGENSYQGGQGGTPRGLMGNAQTHCIQLPNTFAFVRGATGKSLTEADFVQFAENLIPGQGKRIVQAWQTLPGTDFQKMLSLADTLDALPNEKLEPGRLKGLLFGSPRRFVGDLSKMLRYRAALEEFSVAIESGKEVKKPFRKLLKAATVWQQQHGYENFWYDPKLHQALRKLNSPAINSVLDISYEVKEPFDSGIHTPAEQLKANFHKIETYTPQLLAAMKTAYKAIKEKE